MIWTRVVVLVLGLAGLAGCSGGGGNGDTTVGAAWPKFRHDLNNSAQGSGPVVYNPGGTPTPVSILWATNIDGTALSGSPVIGLNGNIYIGSEGGTLAALDPDDGLLKWTTNTCVPTTGPPCTATLGPLVSSPATFTGSPITSNVTTASIVVASTTGSVYAFEYNGFGPPTCAFCFQPTVADSTLTSATFLSSPTFAINVATGGALGVFIGAQVTEQGSSEPAGRLYALNVDGTVKWQFPRRGDPPIGTITSSPAIGVGNTMYFTTDDGFLYALTLAGDLKWHTQVTNGIEVAIGPSPVTSASSVITSFADGVIRALNADGSPYWRRPAPIDASDFANSLAVGFPANTATPTPGPATFTPTPTGTIPPVIPLVAVVGVRKSGSVVLLNAATGECLRKAETGECLPLQPPTDLPATIVGPVLSSPALSSDGYIVIGDHAGQLHAVSTLDGTEPRGWEWPIALVHGTQIPGTPTPTPQPIRSSPAINSNGTVYVGSDDGYLYAVGVPQ